MRTIKPKEIARLIKYKNYGFRKCANMYICTQKRKRAKFKLYRSQRLYMYVALNGTIRTAIFADNALYNIEFMDNLSLRIVALPEFEDRSIRPFKIGL